MPTRGEKPRSASKSKAGKPGGKNTPKGGTVKDKTHLLECEISQRLSLLKDKFSRKFLAEAAGVALNSFDRYTSGEQKPGFEVLARVADATGCDPGWLLLGRGEPFPTADPAHGARIATVRTAWASTLHLLRAATETQRALAPLIGPEDAGPTAELVGLIDNLTASINDLQELAARRGEPIPDPDFDSPLVESVHARRLAADADDDAPVESRTTE